MKTGARGESKEEILMQGNWKQGVSLCFQTPTRTLKTFDLDSKKKTIPEGGGGRGRDRKEGGQLKGGPLGNMSKLIRVWDPVKEEGSREGGELGGATKQWRWGRTGRPRPQTPKEQGL